MDKMEARNELSRIYGLTMNGLRIGYELEDREIVVGWQLQLKTVEQLQKRL